MCIINKHLIPLTTFHFEIVHMIHQKFRQHLQLKALYIGFLLCLLGPGSHALHLHGGIITYTKTTGNTYNIRMILYEDCSGPKLAPFLPNFPTTVIYLRNRCGGSAISLNMTRLPSPISLPGRCDTTTSACTGGTGNGIVEHLFEATHTFPSSIDSFCNLWDLTWGDTANTPFCCHSGAGNLISSIYPPFYLHSFLNNNANNGNSSGALRLTTKPFYCVNWPIEMRMAQNEPDGDSLVYKLTAPLLNLNTLIAHRPGLSASQPFFNLVDTVRINQTDGSIRYKVSSSQVSILVLQRDEHRAGQLVGSISLVTKAWIGSSNCANIKDSIVYSGCDSVVHPDGRVFYNSTSWNDTLSSVFACDTLRSVFIRVENAQAGGIAGPDSVNLGSSNTYIVQNPMPNYTYRWIALGGIALPDTGIQTQVQWTTRGIGQLQLRSTSTTTCVANDTMAVTIGTGVSVAETAVAVVRIFPNPAKDKLFIQSELPIQQLHLMQLTGQLIEAWRNDASEMEIDLKHLSAGTYLLGIQTKQGISHHRILIER